MLEKKNDNCIVLCTDDNYMKYTLVVIQSILNNAVENVYYDIVIFHDDTLSNESKELLNKITLTEMQSIRLYNIEEYIKDCNFIIKSNYELTNPTYYRCFIPEICKEYIKAVYLDCDTFVRADINEIFSIDLEDNMLGVTPELSRDYNNIPMVIKLRFKKKTGIYPDMYFSSDLLLFDIKNCNDNNFVEKCINMINDDNVYAGNDNDIVCSVAYEKIKQIDLNWNSCTSFTYFHHVLPDNVILNVCKNMIGKKFKEEITNFWDNPKIVHFDVFYKPWQNKVENVKFSDEWKQVYSDIFGKE